MFFLFEQPEMINKLGNTKTKQPTGGVSKLRWKSGVSGLSRRSRLPADAIGLAPG